MLLSGHIVSIHAPAWGATSKLTSSQYSEVVSIHAPAWGATAPPPLSGCCSSVSIHAPAWGATYIGITQRQSVNSFNPRSRVGSDLPPYAQWCRCRSFNPRSRVGSDASYPDTDVPGGKFQSTLPRGERRNRQGTNAHSILFQSTLPRGERLM